MGGHSFGDIASKIVVDDMSSHWKKHVKNENEVMMGLDLIEVPQMHELLTLIYVMRMTDEEVMKKMNMSEQLFKKTRKVADSVLLAKRLGRARTWVDNKFCHQNKTLVIYIEKWWSTYCH